LATPRYAERNAFGLASCDENGAIWFDSGVAPFADGGIVREPDRDELIPAPAGTIEYVLPDRKPLTSIGPIAGRHALAVALPAGFTRLLLPAYAVAASGVRARRTRSDDRSAPRARACQSNFAASCALFARERMFHRAKRLSRIR
jgi:hypothetical protein